MALITFVEDKYDAIILHQVPDRRRKISGYHPENPTRKDPAFFIYGSQSDINAFNEHEWSGENTAYQFSERPGFSTVQILDLANSCTDPGNIASLNNFTPVSVPFANFAVNTGGNHAISKSR
jgi:hypothetical protein